MRRRWRKNPKSVTRKYRDWAEELLGITDPSQFWQFKDVSHRLLPQFGKLKSNWRCHFWLSEILSLLSNQRFDHAEAYTVQALKALHQTALDKGAWETALLLMPTPDPLAHLEFAGTESEMLAVAQYRKGLEDLRKAHLPDPAAAGAPP